MGKEPDAYHICNHRYPRGPQGAFEAGRLAHSGRGRQAVPGAGCVSARAAEQRKAPSPSISQTCASETEAVDGRLLETQSLSTTLAQRLPTRVDGIVPNGVHRVTVRSSDGASRTVPVARNAYEVIVVNPRSVAFVAERAGRRRYIVRTPSVAGGKP
jgi:hypothetical protein